MDLFEVAEQLSKPEPDPFDWGQFVSGRKARNRLGHECTFVGEAPPPPAGWRKPMFIYSTGVHVFNNSTLGKTRLYYLVDDRGVWEGRDNGWSGAPDLVEMV